MRKWTNIEPGIAHMRHNTREERLSVGDPYPIPLPPLAPYDTLPDITERFMHEPITYHRVGQSGNHLIVVGVEHQFIPDTLNFHYKEVRQKAETFLSLTDSSQERALIVEGGLRDFNDVIPEEAYWFAGEAGLASRLMPTDVTQVCFEPANQGFDYLLEEGFSKEEIGLFLFCRWVPSWARGNRPFHREHYHTPYKFSLLPLPTKEDDFEPFAQKRLANAGRISGSWPELPFTYKQLVKLYENTYDKPFTPEDPATAHFLRKETTGYMLPRRSSIHAIAIAVNRHRDEELAKGVRWLWEKGASIFLPFGYPHIMTLEPYITSLGIDYQTYQSQQEKDYSNCQLGRTALRRSRDSSPK